MAAAYYYVNVFVTLKSRGEIRQENVNIKFGPYLPLRFHLFAFVPFIYALISYLATIWLTRIIILIEVVVSRNHSICSSQFILLNY